jgi:hypothetical protein
MRQQTFAADDFAVCGTPTHRERFQGEMERVVPRG